MSSVFYIVERNLRIVRLHRMHRGQVAILASGRVPTPTLTHADSSGRSFDTDVPHAAACVDWVVYGRHLRGMRGARDPGAAPERPSGRDRGEGSHHRGSAWSSGLQSIYRAL